MSVTSSLHLSVLDLAPIPSGSSSTQALANSLSLAQLTEGLGYTRYWVAEHHNMPGLASAVPAVLIGYLAAGTTRIRVGSGGVMLPNHPALHVAETFRLLEALHPGRIDLGIGRAPGTDQLTALALRRSRAALSAEDFPEQLGELLAFFSGLWPEDHPFGRIVAVPTDTATPEMWLLGSSDYSAQVAAALGLSFAFAHHINPALAVAALQLYRAQFTPSPTLAAPRALLTVSAICADSDVAALALATSGELSFLALQQGKRLPQLPSVAEAHAYPYTDLERAQIQLNRGRAFVGAPTTLRPRLLQLVQETGVDELMITTITHSAAARARSYTLLAEALRGAVAS